MDLLHWSFFRSDSFTVSGIDHRYDYRRVPVGLERPLTIEWFHAVNALSWGLYLMLPFRAMDYGLAWLTMRQMMPEEYWAILMTGIGIGHLLVLLHRDIDQRATAMFLGSCLWMFVALSLWRIRSPMLPTVWCLWVFCTWTYLRLRRIV